MFTRPDLADDSIVAALRERWGITVSALACAAVGFGSHHWQVRSDDTRWFITIDDLHAKQHGRTVDEARRWLVAALTSAARLRDAGLDFVVAPSPTIEGSVSHDLDERFVMVVYPHIEGRMRDYGPYAAHEDRMAVLDLLAQVHHAPPACRTDALVDDLELAGRAGLTTAIGEIDMPWTTGPFAEPSRQLLATHAPAVVAAMHRYDELVERVRTRRERMVLTHGEPHPANTIVTGDGVQLIDWDTTLIAPPERDLWELIDEDPIIADAYAERTGTTIDTDAVDLYRLTWDLSEIGIYIGEFRRPHTTTADTSTAWANLQLFLDPTRW